MTKDIIYSFGLYGLAFIVNLKWIKKIYKLGKIDDRIPILQLDPGAKNKTKTKPRYESWEMALKLELDSRLDWKIVETF